MAEVEQLVLQAKTCFQAKDYETCMSLTDEALRTDPANAEASWLLKEAQRQWEDQRSLEQLEIYVENLKKEAMDLFDKEHYEQCLGMFRFLSELEPENHTLRDYVRLSQQLFVETIGSREAATSEQSVGSDPAPRAPSEVTCPSIPVEAACQTRFDESDLDGNHSAVAVEKTKIPSTAILDIDHVPQSIRDQIIEEHLARNKRLPQKPSSATRRAAALSLLTALGAGCFWFTSSFREKQIQIDIETSPQQASVFIDDKKVGETPLRQQDFPSGSHALRIEKPGYQPYRRNLAGEGAQAIILAVQLEKSKAISTGPSATPPIAQRPEEVTSQLPFVSEAVETEADPVQIAQSVIHHHLLGSCTGRLKIDGERISFWSSGSSHDGFTRKISQIVNFQLSERLLIEFKDKAYRFEALARDSKDSRARLVLFYDQIKLQKALARNAM